MTIINVNIRFKNEWQDGELCDECLTRRPAPVGGISDKRPAPSVINSWLYYTAFCLSPSIINWVFLIWTYYALSHLLCTLISLKNRITHNYPVCYLPESRGVLSSAYFQVQNMKVLIFIARQQITRSAYFSSTEHESLHWHRTSTNHF